MRISISDPDCLRLTRRILAEGGVAVLPCDTIYGIVGKAPKAEGRICSIKGRTETKPFLMLIGSVEWLKAFTDLAVPEDLLPFWPGPLTLLFPGKSPNSKFAFRMPADKFLLEILSDLGKPLYSTSVNVSGKKPLWKIDEIDKAFGRTVDLIVDAGDLEGGRPSTILDITVKPYQVVRQGKLIIPPHLLQG